MPLPQKSIHYNFKFSNFVLMRFLFLFFLGFGPIIHGQINNGAKPVVLPKKERVALPSTTTYMELNNVRAMIHTAVICGKFQGKIFLNMRSQKNSGIMALFTAALWLEEQT